MSDAAPRAGHVVSFIDIGTNSVRMMVVRLNPNLSYTVLSQEKEMVRLGAGGFDDMFLRRDAIDRTVLVCRKFVELSRYYGADEIIAVATSAAREAGNQNVLVERLREDVGVELGIISGIEEARLVFLGVASGLELADRTALMIDIGGGSTELALGTGRGHEYLDSLKLGAIRMTDLFIPRGHQGAVSEKTYAAMKKHVRGYMSQATRCIRKSHTDVAIGSSGTIVNLSEMAVRSLGGQPGTLRLSHLRKLASTIRSFMLKERRMLPGINPERADIIIGGAAVLEAIMEELRIDELRVSERGVREGLLVDYLARIEGSPHAQGKGVRETSILQLGRSCDVDEGHAATVERLSLSIRPVRPGCTTSGTRSGSSCDMPPTSMTWATSSRSPTIIYIPTTSSGTPTSWCSTRRRWPSWPPWPAITARRRPAARTRNWPDWIRRPMRP